MMFGPSVDDLSRSALGGVVSIANGHVAFIQPPRAPPVVSKIGLTVRWILRVAKAFFAHLT
jgi:hypothetical protein